MTKTIRKKFEKSEYDECDKKAKVAVRDFLNSLGCPTVIRDEDYGPDIKSIRETFHEVEIKKGWTGEWPCVWDWVQLPARKKRLVDEYGEVVFWIIAGDLKRAVVVKGEHLEPKYLREVKNKKVAEGEKFYCIPKWCFKIVEIEVEEEKDSKVF
jgi:hypothetical protein